MGVRKATGNDLVPILEMSFKFLESTHYKDYFDPIKLGKVIGALITDDDKVFLIDAEYRGFITGIITSFVFGEILQATELGWWVELEHRDKKIGEELLYCFENWAKENECALITMIDLGEQLGSFYEKNGYKLVEKAYIKEI